MRTLVRGGTIVSATAQYAGDVLVEDERIAAVTGRDGDGAASTADAVIDATGCFVLPGLVDSHTHLALEFGGTMSADDFDSGTRAAAAGGTTSIVDFAFQTGGSLLAGLDAWKAKAEGRAHVDYGFHVVVTDPTPAAIAEIPHAIAAGASTFKLFMAYEGLRLDDGDLLRVLEVVREHGALPLVHAENDAAAVWLGEREIAAGHTEPRYHAVARPPAVEAEATGRVIQLAALADTPLFVVHVTCADALAEVRRARAAGLPVFGEACAHYLTLGVEELSRPGFEGAKFVCSPPLRETSDRDALWSGLREGALQVSSTDHCSFDFAGGKDKGRDDFRSIPYGLPTIEMRLAVLYTDGVLGGRLSLPELVRITSTAPAQIFGLTRKGTLDPGADADLVLLDPERTIVASAATHRMNVDYNPYEGRVLHGMPRLVMSRGEVVVQDGEVVSTAGRGRYLERVVTAAGLR